ncbi:MAG: helix-turn-helix transcriptional regulator [Clostridia bacterium]|nr:helix-turn-helix transcriptional regulator [Clostridia bacterium]
MIRENRLKNKLTQEELAEKVDISWRQLQRIEKNEEETRVKTLKKLVKVLNIPNEEVLEYLHR